MGEKSNTGEDIQIPIASRLPCSLDERKIMSAGKVRVLLLVTMSVEEGCWVLVPLERECIPVGCRGEALCLCTSLPHSEPMQVPTQVTNVLARSSSRLQCLAGPRVVKASSYYENIYPEAVIRPVRQHHPGLCMAGTLGRGEGTGCPVTSGSLHGSPGCAAVREADVAASWAGEQDSSSTQSMNWFPADGQASA